MKSVIGAGLLALAGLGLAGCNTASNDVATNTGPTLNTGLSTAGLYLDATVSGADATGSIWFNNASSIKIPSGGNPDGLTTFTVNSSTGKITFTPDTGQIPGIYPIYINGTDSSGVSNTQLFLAYLYGTSGGVAVPANSTQPPVAPFSISVNGLTGPTGNSSGTVSLGIHYGFSDDTVQAPTATIVSGNANAASISITKTFIFHITGTDKGNVSTTFKYNFMPSAGAGASTCSNGVLLLLSAKPYYNNLQSPAPFQEYVCLMLTS
jgi:hypothetical protein